MRKLLFPLAFFVFFFAGGNASATIVPKKDIAKLINTSSLIFVGQVVEIDEHAYDYSTNSPQTMVTFTVQEILEGLYNKTYITFTLPYGYKPNNSYFEIVGAPHFLLGEKYLFFVKDGDWNLTPTANWHHSVFRSVVIGGAEYWVDQYGFVVDDINSSGVKLGQKVALSEHEKNIALGDNDEEFISSDQSLAAPITLGALANSKESDEILDVLDWFIQSTKESVGATATEDKRISLKPKRAKTNSSFAAIGEGVSP